MQLHPIFIWRMLVVFSQPSKIAFFPFLFLLLSRNANAVMSQGDCIWCPNVRFVDRHRDLELSPSHTRRAAPSRGVLGFEASAFEDHDAAIVEPTVSNVSEAFHVAFEVKEEWEGSGRRVKSGLAHVGSSAN